MMIMKMGGCFSISFFLGVLFFIAQFGIQYSDAVVCPSGIFEIMKNGAPPPLPIPNKNCSSACAIYTCGGNFETVGCVEDALMDAACDKDGVAFIKGRNPNKMSYQKADIKVPGNLSSAVSIMHFVSGCGEAAENEVIRCLANRDAEFAAFGVNVITAYPDACKKGGVQVFWEVNGAGSVCGKEFLAPPPTPKGSDGKTEKPAPTTAAPENGSDGKNEEASTTTAATPNGSDGKNEAPPTEEAPNGSNGMWENGWNFAGILLFAAAPLFAWMS